MRFPRATLLLVAAASLGACDSPAVEWSDPVAIAGSPGATRLVLDTTGAPRLVSEAAPVGTPPGDAARCATSLRTARGASRLYAVWWSVRPDSSARLDAAWSPDDGRTWGDASPVDTADVSSRGCDRPPPSLATSGDDLHIAYSMAAPEGTGVFFAHFMGSMLHSPVAVIYGERIVPTAIAAEGDLVAVAYDEPNGRRQQVDVALSRTQGHIFEWHGAASRSVDAARTPAIALSGSHIAVAWTTRGRSDTASARVVRVGRLRP